LSLCLVTLWVAPKQTFAQSIFVNQKSEISFLERYSKKECVCQIGKYFPIKNIRVYSVIVDDTEYNADELTNEELENVLDCMYFEESSNGKNLYGDHLNGVPRAFGNYQIWLSVHPDVSYECAFDYKCSRDWTKKQILAHHERWWPSYSKCKNKLYGN